MRIVCAQSVLRAREAFETLGPVELIPDREIARAHLMNADALVVRSKTAIHMDLLAGTPVRYAGTATAGFDHIDTGALDSAGIRWFAAAGCNAESVAEYITATLLLLAVREGVPLTGRRLGVIGVGQVGRRVARNAQALGIEVLLNDPPRQEAEGAADLLEAEAVLSRCDVVTLHVPLTDDGPHATRGMVDADWIGRLPRGTWFLNASRGEVVREPALIQAMESGHLRRIALDVWDHEPDLDATLLRRVDLGTPHIAGYSYDGKLRGTEMVYADLCRTFGLEPNWDVASCRPAPTLPETSLDARGLRDEEALHELVRRIYAIEVDNRALREPFESDPKLRAERFEHLRKSYPPRREFPFTRVRVRNGSPALSAKIEGLRFAR